jgi:hypothetical protein
MKKSAALKHREVPARPGLASRQARIVAPVWRAPLMAAAVLVLLASLWGGLLRIGWDWPVLQPGLAGTHGALMIAGFFGTLISLERAVALRTPWAYLAPALSALGGVLLIAGIAGPMPALLLTAASYALVLVFVEIIRRQWTRYTLIMAAGALSLAIGNSLWILGWPVYRLVLWWAAFLILTIAGERLELGRLARLPRRVEDFFSVALVVFLFGLLLYTFLPDPGWRLASAGLLGLVLWLARFDIARKTVRQVGLPRFAALCLLSGYVWLVVAGAIGLANGASPTGFLYDAFLHAIFLGFVFAMIFAHAPIIFPAILDLPIKFDRLHYIPLLLLHSSLLVRMLGNLALLPQLRMWGGMLNGVTILAFLFLTARSVVVGVRERALDRKM